MGNYRAKPFTITPKTSRKTKGTKWKQKATEQYRYTYAVQALGPHTFVHMSRESIGESHIGTHNYNYKGYSLKPNMNRLEILKLVQMEWTFVSSQLHSWKCRRT